MGTTRYATAVHVEEAIQGAVRAFEITRRMGAFERQRILRSISHGMDRQREDLAQLLAMEAGKPLKAARVEVERSCGSRSTKNREREFGNRADREQRRLERV